MKTTCPHCSAQIEIDAPILAALQGHSHFACPSCNNPVPVPPPPGARPVAPVRVHGVGPQTPHPSSSATLARAHRGLNRNFLILGATALLVLGGIAFMLASKKSGNTHSTTQNIRNEVINNSYFQNLIGTGVTTIKDLDAIADIRPYGDGFIGISKEALAWELAEDLTKRTGSEILAVEDRPASSRQELLAWLSKTFNSHLSSTVWVSERGQIRVLDGVDILATAAKDRPRKVVLQWLSESPGHSSPDAKRNFLESVFSNHGSVKILQSRKIIDVNRVEDLPSGSFQLAHVDQVKGDFDDADAAMLAKFPELTSIRLARSSVTSLPLAGLQQLQNLELDNCQVTDERLQQLVGCSKLNRIHLRGTPIGRPIVSILAKCANLEYVGIQEIDLLDGDLEPLAQLTRLKRVRLSANSLSDAGLGVLAGIHTLEFVELSKLNPDTVTLSTLQQLPVTTFKFYLVTVTRPMLENIAKMSKMRFIEVEAGKIAEESLQPLFGMKQLEGITLKNLPISEAAVDELKRALPNVRIVR